MSTKIRLIAGQYSSCSWRVRLALTMKGLEFEETRIGESISEEEYQLQNPNDRVPCLMIDDLCITQSFTMLEYLDESRPTCLQLLPSDPQARVYVRDLCYLIICDIQPLQNRGSVRTKVMALADSPDRGQVFEDWGREWITRGFAAFEKMLVKCSGKFCVGDTLTYADVVLVPQVFNALRFKVDLSQFPTLVAIHNRLQQLPQVQASHPDLQ